MRRLGLLLLCLALAGCVRQPAHREQGTEALVRTWGSFVSIDGEQPESSRELFLEPGLHFVEVRYSTYRFDYICGFEFEARAGTRYEIIDQSNDQPLTLYRWRRQNALWSRRIDPVAPESCRQQSRTHGPDSEQSP